MLEYIKRQIADVYRVYIEDYRSASIYGGNSGIRGVRIDKKSDVRRAMLMDVGALLEVAKLEGITNKELGVKDSLAAEAKKAKENGTPFDEVNIND